MNNRPDILNGKDKHKALLAKRRMQNSSHYQNLLQKSKRLGFSHPDAIKNAEEYVVKIRAELDKLEDALLLMDHLGFNKKDNSFYQETIKNRVTLNAIVERFLEAQKRKKNVNTGIDETSLNTGTYEELIDGLVALHEHDYKGLYNEFLKDKDYLSLTDKVSREVIIDFYGKQKPLRTANSIHHLMMNIEFFKKPEFLCKWDKGGKQLPLERIINQLAKLIKRYAPRIEADLDKYRTAASQLILRFKNLKERIEKDYGAILETHQQKTEPEIDEEITRQRVNIEELNKLLVKCYFWSPELLKEIVATKTELNNCTSIHNDLKILKLYRKHDAEIEALQNSINIIDNKLKNEKNGLIFQPDLNKPCLSIDRIFKNCIAVEKYFSERDLAQQGVDKIKYYKEANLKLIGKGSMEEGEKICKNADDIRIQIKFFEKTLAVLEKELTTNKLSSLKPEFESMINFIRSELQSNKKKLEIYCRAIFAIKYDKEVTERILLKDHHELLSVADNNKHERDVNAVKTNMANLLGVVEKFLEINKKAKNELKNSLDYHRKRDADEFYSDYSSDYYANANKLADKLNKLIENQKGEEDRREKLNERLHAILACTDNYDFSFVDRLKWMHWKSVIKAKIERMSHKEQAQYDFAYEMAEGEAIINDWQKFMDPVLSKREFKSFHQMMDQLENEEDQGESFKKDIQEMKKFLEAKAAFKNKIEVGKVTDSSEYVNFLTNYNQIKTTTFKDLEQISAATKVKLVKSEKKGKEKPKEKLKSTSSLQTSSLEENDTALPQENVASHEQFTQLNDLYLQVSKLNEENKITMTKEQKENYNKIKNVVDPSPLARLLSFIPFFKQNVSARECARLSSSANDLVTDIEHQIQLKATEEAKTKLATTVTINLTTTNTNTDKANNNNNAKEDPIFKLPSYATMFSPLNDKSAIQQKSSLLDKRVPTALEVRQAMTQRRQPNQFIIKHSPEMMIHKDKPNNFFIETRQKNAHRKLAYDVHNKNQNIHPQDLVGENAIISQLEKLKTNYKEVIDNLGKIGRTQLQDECKEQKAKLKLLLKMVKGSASNDLNMIVSFKADGTITSRPGGISDHVQLKYNSSSTTSTSKSLKEIYKNLALIAGPDYTNSDYAHPYKFILKNKNNPYQAPLFQISLPLNAEEIKILNAEIKVNKRDEQVIVSNESLREKIINTYFLYHHQTVMLMLKDWIKVFEDHCSLVSNSLPQQEEQKYSLHYQYRLQ